MNPQTMNTVKESIERKLGIPYEVFDELSFEEQQALIRKYHRTHPQRDKKMVHVMLGSGEDAIFVKVPKGKKVMLTSGDDSIIVRAGLTRDEVEEDLESRLEEAIYSKPVAFVKKIQRKMKRTKK